MGIITALTVLFVAMKMTGYIAWSWWVVITAPIWLGLGIICLLFIGAGLITGLAYVGIIGVESINKMNAFIDKRIK